MVAETPKALLDAFWGLRADEDTVRAEAAKTIIEAVAAGLEPEQVDYVVQRLIRGLGSPRASARRGFMLVLSALSVPSSVVLCALKSCKAEPHPLRPLLALECILCRLECATVANSAVPQPTVDDLRCMAAVFCDIICKPIMSSLLAPYVSVGAELLCAVRSFLPSCRSSCLPIDSLPRPSLLLALHSNTLLTVCVLRFFRLLVLASR